MKHLLYTAMNPNSIPRAHTKKEESGTVPHIQCDLGDVVSGVRDRQISRIPWPPSLAQPARARPNREPVSKTKVYISRGVTHKIALVSIYTVLRLSKGTDLTEYIQTSIHLCIHIKGGFIKVAYRLWRYPNSGVSRWKGQALV